MSIVRPKKSLGQHFLADKNIARKIVSSLNKSNHNNILEVGPGMGILTQFLIEKENCNLKLIELDSESVNYLKSNFPQLTDQLFHQDFLEFDIASHFSQLAIIGNFPYNISSQIFFKVLENRNVVDQVVGMVQKEVAERIAAKHNSKTYGILSVLLQAFYKIEYLFTVNKTVFIPPPNVQSAVIRLTRNIRIDLGCDEKLFFIIVKAAFNQRRKIISNSLKTLNIAFPDNPIFLKRPEQLSVDEFIFLTQLIEKTSIEKKIDD